MAPSAFDSSFRYLPSKYAQAHLSGHDIRRAFYRTMSSTQFTGQPVAPDSQGENMTDLYSIGERDGKYMKHQLNRAPLVDRNSCKYTQDFFPLPLDQHPGTREMADEIKAKNLSGGDTVNTKFFDGASKYVEEFKKYSQQAAAEAKQASVKPAQELTKTSMQTDELHEYISHEQRKFVNWQNHKLAKAESALPPPSNLSVGKFTVHTNTSYKDQFKGKQLPRRARPQRCSSAPASRQHEKAKAAEHPSAATVESLEVMRQHMQRKPSSRPASAVDGKRNSKDKSVYTRTSQVLAASTKRTSVEKLSSRPVSAPISKHGRSAACAAQSKQLQVRSDGK